MKGQHNVYGNQIEALIPLYTLTHNNILLTAKYYVNHPLGIRKPESIVIESQLSW